MTNDNKIHISETERKAFSAIGRLGGKASFKKKGRKGMSEMGKHGMQVRWHSKKTNKINNKEK